MRTGCPRAQFESMDSLLQFIRFRLPGINIKKGCAFSGRRIAIKDNVEFGERIKRSAFKKIVKKMAVFFPTAGIFFYREIFRPPS
jgi:hypothetical protein